MAKRERPTLPIRFREKLAPGFGYPVEDEVLDRFIGKVGGSRQLTVGYYRHPMFLPSAAAAALRASGSVPLLKSSHIHLQPERAGLHPSLVADWSDDVWELSIYAIPLPMLGRGRALLVGPGLLRLIAWLERPPGDGRINGRRALEIRLRKSDGGLEVIETP